MPPRQPSCHILPLLFLGCLSLVAQAAEHPQTDLAIPRSQVESTGPTVVITRAPSPAILNIANRSIELTITFSEPVSGFTDGDLIPGTGTLSPLVGSGTTYTTTWTTPLGSFGAVAFQVPAGVATGSSGPNQAADPFDLAFDTDAPLTPEFNNPTEGMTVGGNSVFYGYIDNEYYQPVVRYRINGGTWIDATMSTIISHRMWQWTAAPLNLPSGAVTFEVQAFDDSENPSAINIRHVLMDNSPPSLTVQSPFTPTSTNHVMLSGTTNDPLADIVVTDENHSTVAMSADAGLNWVATTSALSDGDHTLTITAYDDLGNASTAIIVSVLVDATGPNTVFGVPSKTIVKTGDDIAVTVHYSDNILGVAAITLNPAQVLQSSSGSALDTVTVDGTGTATRTMHLTNFTGDGTLAVSIASGSATDTLGNPASASTTTLVFTVDNTAPSMALSTLATSPTNLSRIPVSLTTSEAVTGLTSADLLVTHGTIENFSGSDSTYTFDLIPAADVTSVDVTVKPAAAVDAVGNQSTISNTIALAVDNTAPSVTLSSLIPSHTNPQRIPVSLTVSEAVTGLSSTDLLVSHATIENFSGSGSTYRFDLVPDPGATAISVSVPAGAVHDGIGNPSQTSAVLSFNFSNDEGNDSGCGLGGLGLFSTALMFLGLRRRRG